jgi:hypothetical protein
VYAAKGGLWRYKKTIRAIWAQFVGLYSRRYGVDFGKLNPRRKLRYSAWPLLGPLNTAKLSTFVPTSPKSFGSPTKILVFTPESLTSLDTVSNVVLAEIFREILTPGPNLGLAPLHRIYF